MEENRKRRKKRKVNGKRVIPVLVAIALIIAVVAVFYGDKIIEKYSYSDERADLNEYFKIYSEQDVAVILQDEKTDYYGKMVDGRCYLPFSMIEDVLVERFYVNTVEKKFSYTNALDVITVNYGEKASSYYVSGREEPGDYIIAFEEDGLLYIAADYVKHYANFSYEIYKNPYRMVLYTEWGSKTVADVNKETAVRYQGGVKSPILEDMVIGDSVYVLESMENWSKVRTKDGIIGYIENKRLENQRAEEQTPVTDVLPLQIEGYTKDYKINMAFHQVFAASGNDTFDSYTKDMTGVNVIAPTWIRLRDSEGNIDSIASRDYVAKAHDKGMEVWAVVTDVDSEVDLYPLFSSSEKRKVLIDNLIYTCTDNGIDGINIDIEKVSAETGEHFIQFIRELSTQTRCQGLVLSIDNYAPTASTQHYDRVEQGLYADYVVVMGYDEHWGGGGVAGSVASIGFVEQGIQATLQEVPANKLINAIPFYTRLWKTENGTVTSEALGMDKAREVLSNAGVEPEWKEDSCQNYAEYHSGDALYQIWLEDEESIQAKLNVMQANHIGGVAEWKLGFENDDIWELITSYVNTAE